jgi:hypothetical protein
MCAGAAGLPQAQRADALGAVAGDHHVVGLGRHLAGVAPDRRMPGRLGPLDPAAEAHRVVNARGAETPRACRLPARGRGARSGGRPGCSARTCRTRSGCRSRRRAGPAWPSNRGSRPPAGPGRRCPARRRAPASWRSSSVRAWRRQPAGGGAAGQRGQRIAQAAADQELHRQVVDPARPRRGRRVRGHPAARQLLARHLGHGMHHVLGRGLAGRHAHGVQQVASTAAGRACKAASGFIARSMSGSGSVGKVRMPFKYVVVLHE